MDGECLNASERRIIEDAVMETLEASDMEAATEFSIRAAAEKRVGFSLSSLSHRQFVQKLIDSFLLATAAAALNDARPRGNSPAINRNNNGENGDYNGKIICKLSDKRMVTVYDLYGTTMVAIRDFDLIHGNMRPSKGENSGLSLRPAQWSSFRNSFPSIQAAIVKLESRLSDVNPASNLNHILEATTKQSEAAMTNLVAEMSDSTSIFSYPIKTEQMESESRARNPTSDSEAERTQTQPGISNIAAKISQETPHSLPHFTPVSQEKRPTDMNQTKADIPYSISHSPNQVHMHDTTSLVQPEQSSPGKWKQIEANPLELSHYTSNPLRPQQLVPIQPARLDGRNYNSWRAQMEFSLKQLKIAYVLAEPCPSMSSNSNESPDEKVKVKAAIQRWIDDDYMCRHNILNSLSDILFQLYSPKNYSARELWEEIESAHYEDFGTKRSQINNYIQFQMAEGVPIAEQARELGRIADSIIASGVWIDEYFHVSMIISKLPPSWWDFRARLMHEDFLPLNVLMRRLQEEEECRKKEFNFRKVSVDPKLESRLGVRKRGSDKRVCYNCGKEGHISAHCWERKFEKGGEKENEDARMENMK